MRGPGDVLYNFHWIVAGEAARAAQAYAGFLGPFLKRHGIRSLINLRGFNPDFRWWRYEKRVSKKGGVKHIDVMMDSRSLPRRDMLANLFDAFERAPKPFLIKCSGGQDRTSFAAALYLVHRSGWTAMQDAAKQFAWFPYLHFPRRHQRWLRQFLDFAQDDAAGRPIAEWVRERYDPVHLKDWLESHGHAGAFKDICEKPLTGIAQW
jgi:hypothetical protein